MILWWMAYLFLLLPKQPQTPIRTPQVSVASEAMAEKTSSSVSAPLHDHNRVTLLVRTGGRRRDDQSSLHLHPSSSFPVFRTSGVSWSGWGWPCLVLTFSAFQWADDSDSNVCAVLLLTISQPLISPWILGNWAKLPWEKVSYKQPLFKAQGWFYQFSFKTSGIDCSEADGSPDEVLVWPSWTSKTTLQE